MDDTARAEGAPMRSGRAVGWLAAILVVSLAARAPSLKIPLDQDSAVYSYAAERWLEGGLPYRDAWDHKAPFIYLIYAGVYAVGPVSTVALRAAAAACDAGTLVLLFLVARRLFEARVALWAALLYGLLTAAPTFHYEAFQVEHAMLLFVTGAMLAAVAYSDSRKLRYAALSGLLFGLALAAKQTAAPLGAFVWAWLTVEAFRRDGSGALGRVVGHSLLLLVGAALPLAAFAAYFKAQGPAAWKEFWFCTIQYNARYAAEDRTYGGLVAGAVKFLKAMAFRQGFLWLAAAAGMLAALAGRLRSGIVVAGWAACALLSCLIPGQPAPYYFLQTVVPLAIAGGVTLAALAEGVRRGPVLDARNVLACVVLLGALGVAAKDELGRYRAATHPQSGNQTAVDIGRYLGQHTGPEDRLFVWGSRSQIYFAARRKAACRFLYNYSYNQSLDRAFHLRDEARTEILAALREHEPPFIVATETTTLDDPKGFGELRDYLKKHYVDHSDDGFQHTWPTRDPYVPEITIFRRKGR